MPKKQCESIAECPGCGSKNLFRRGNDAEVGFYGRSDVSKDMRVVITFEMTCEQCGCKYWAELKGVVNYAETFWGEEDDKERAEHEALIRELQR